MSEVKISQLIGNVLDHWEQLPNDIRSDPGFTALDKCLEKLYRAQRTQQKEGREKKER